MRILTICVLIFWSSHIYASELAKCKNTTDEQQRLSCYDRYAKIVLVEKDNNFGKAKFKDIPDVQNFVVSTTLKRNNQYILAMKNGQVWRQIDSYKGLRIREGDNVVINSGALTAYYLKKNNDGPQIKVKRVK